MLHRAQGLEFLCGPGQVLSNLRVIVLLRPKRYLGHSPAGGAMVVILLAMLAATTVTGILAEESTHPLRPPLSWPALWRTRTATGRIVRALERRARAPLVETQEVLADLTLSLVFVHIAGVILASFTHRENLIVSMFTGRKRA